MTAVRLRAAVDRLALDQFLDNLPAGDADLLVPLDLKQRYFGGTTGAMQAIATWRAGCHGSLRLYLDGGRPLDGAGLLTRHDHLLWGVLVAARTTDPDGRDLTRDLLGHAYERLARMDRLEPGRARRGGKLFALAADHTGNATPLLLYPNKGSDRVKTQAEFKSLLHEVFTEWSVTEVSPDGETLEHLSDAIHEFYENTHKWARTDAYSHPVRPSLRSLRIEHFNLAWDEYRSARPDPVARFVRRLASDMDRLRVFEVCVTDTGPGLATRRLWEQGVLLPQDSAQEYEAVRDCLSKHYSSHVNPTRGKGFDKALRALTDLRGLVLVRSGGLSLYRDLVAHPYRPPEGGAGRGDVPPEPFLLDFVADSFEVTARPRVQGTDITMLVPVRP